MRGTAERDVDTQEMGMIALYAGPMWKKKGGIKQERRMAEPLPLFLASSLIKFM